MTKLEPRFGGAFFLSHGRGWDAALLGLLEAVAHHGEAGGVVVEGSLIKGPLSFPSK